MLRKTNAEIVSVLEPGSEMLKNIQQEFHVMLEQRQRQGKPTLKVFCFYEELAVVGIGKVCLHLVCV